MENKNIYIYGKNQVVEALEANSDLEKIYLQYGISDGFFKLIKKLSNKNSVPVVTFDKKKFKNLEDQIGDLQTKTQGIIAQRSLVKYLSVEELVDVSLENEPKPIIIILDGITDPHNLGAIARTAYCAGVSGMILPEKNSAPVTSVAVSTSAGAIEHLPLAKTHNLNSAISYLKEKGFWIYGTEMKAEKSIYEEDFDTPTALVIGSEGKGMRQSVENNCDILLKIPMRGKLDSLNASVSAGIVIFEILRKRI